MLKYGWSGEKEENKNRINENKDKYQKERDKI